MKKIACLASAIILLCTTLNQLKAQTTNGQMKLFFEKAYLHIDRAYYVIGDDIWFKAYLLNGQTNYPIYTSNNLYVELIAPNAAVVCREVLRLENGVGNGDFKLNDSLVAGTYYIRAYTNWMRNFGDNFIYEREIKIGNKNIAALDASKSSTATTISASNKAVATIKEDYKLQFFPEGGSLITDVTTVVAFKAEDALGNGVEVKGDVFDSKGKVVASFKSNNIGLGSLTLTPIADEMYDVKAVVASNNKPIDTDIALPIAKGFILTVKDIDTAFVQVTIKTNNATIASLKNALLTIEAKHTGKKYFEDTMRLINETISIKMPKAKLPQGIAVITLLDEKKRPYSERLFYIEKPTTLNVSVATNKKSYTTQENTIVNISTLDFEGHPLKASLSMAVVDATIVPTSFSNIVNYMYLQSDIKGNIEQADRYFDKTNKDRLKELDLLLLTQGWRDYIWLRLAQQGISIKYIPESGITISGSVKRVFNDKPLPSMNITLFANQASGNKLFSTQSDTTGRYFFDGVNITGTSRIKLVSKDNKGKSGGIIAVDELFKNQLPVKAINYIYPVIDTTSAFKLFAISASQRVVDLKKARLLEIGELPGVTVTSRKEKIKLLSDGMAMDAGYKDSVFAPDGLDMKLYETLENYLLHKINGAIVDVDSGGVYFGGLKKVRPRFIVDNREDLFETLDFFRLTVNVISKIVVQHLVSATDPTKDIYIVNLTLKPEANQQAKPDVINREITGYYQARSFYVPQFKSSLVSTNFLTTLFWKSDIETENGNAKVVFTNKTASPKWRIVVEGITENGLPISSIINYEVK